MTLVTPVRLGRGGTALTVIDSRYSFIDPEETNWEALDTLLVLGLMVRGIWVYRTHGSLSL